MSALRKFRYRGLSFPFAAGLFALWITVPIQVQSAPEDSEKNYQKLEEKLKATADPIKKVKILIEMSNHQLQVVVHLAEQRQFPEADQGLSQYQDLIRQTRDLLKVSGRNAQKNPAGFKDFELALRKQLRRLDDLRALYPYEQSKPLEGVIAEVSTTQENMMVELFGESNFGKRKDMK
ncbi:MAG: hypothetical protein U0V70_00570 [Terriglobia bacterium]